MGDILFRQRPVYSENHFPWSNAPQPQAGVIDPHSFTERGLRAKKRCDVISATVVVLVAVAAVALVIGAVFSSRSRDKWLPSPRVRFPRHPFHSSPDVTPPSGGERRARRP
jgi:hypothetical protein